MVSRNQTIENDNMLKALSFPSFAIDLNNQITYWNDLCEEIFGYSQSDFENIESFNQHTFFSSFSDEFWNELKNNRESLILNHFQFMTKHGELVTCTLIVMEKYFQQTNTIFFVCLPDNQFKQIDFLQQELIDLKKGLFSSFMMVTLDHEGFIINSNPLFLKTSHWTPKRVLGKTFWRLFPEEKESKKIAETIWKTITSGHIWQGDVEKITKEGIPYWVHMTAIPTYSYSDQEYHYILIEQDITNEKQMQQRLEKIAYIDTETGLMNVHRLEQVVKEMIEEGRHFYFVYLSIDKFYTLKELDRNSLKNTLINEFTKRLKIYFQDSLMARINENDFVVITPLGEWFIQGFLSYLKQNPIYNENTAVPLSISGGIIHSSNNPSTFEQLMKASHTTIVNVRSSGGNNIVTLSNAAQKALTRKSLIEKRLLFALNQNNLKVLYQPQVDLKTEKVVAVEALVRWEDEEIGIVSPDELIPIAEETGLINNIGKFVIEQACTQAAKWFSEGIELKVGINLSVREFRDKNMAKTILNTLTKTNCPAHLIQIEITEKFALEAEAETSIIEQMKKLENEGISFVLDDFGTGYASFRYMQLLPIETLKIDKMFIDSLLKSEKTERLINGMIQFGKSLDLMILAEGVETEEQRDVLKQLGCDGIQGYLISKAVSPREIKNFVLYQQ